MTSAIANRRATGWVAVAVTLAIGGLATPARADPTPEDKATAEALFEHAKGLMKEGKYAEACPKLEESQRLDAGIGTMLYLADCYEKGGKTASAWAEFLDAASTARAAGQLEREKRARERAATLEPRLNRLSITVGVEVPGVEVQRDGVPVQRALWGTPVPLDPGDHNIVAAAPGKKTWSKLVRLDPADLTPIAIVVPALEDAPLPPAHAEPTPPPLPLAPPDKASSLSMLPPTSPAPPLQLPRKPAPVGVGQVVGYTALGLGLAGAGVSGILGIVTLMDKSDSDANCRGVICNPVGASDRNAALGLASATNIALIAGSAVFATGIVVLLVTRPASAGTDRQVLRIEPLVGPGGLSVRGSY
jgi:serine/threonine-protein kinase